MQQVEILQELQLRGQTRPDTCTVVDEIIDMITDDDKWPLVQELIQYHASAQEAVQFLIETHL